MPIRSSVVRSIAGFHLWLNVSAPVVVAALLLCAGSGTAIGAETSGEMRLVYVSSKSQIASRIGPYEDKRRWQIYTAINKEYLQLWDRGSGKLVATAQTRTFPGFKYLKIEDRNRDGLGDFYAYYPKSSGGPTQEFGAFFDLAGDGSPDWLVFYGGSILGEGGAFNLVYWNHHIIDRNNDGKFDTIVIDCVDMDGDGKIEPGRTAWFYDSNFDGKIDSAQHIEKGRASAIPQRNGRFDARSPLKTFQAMRVGSPIGKLFDMIGRDISSVL